MSTSLSPISGASARQPLAFGAIGGRLIGLPGIAFGDTLLTFLAVLMLIACTAGHALVSALVGPFLALIAVYVTRSAISKDLLSTKREFHYERN
jgi:hypothetical protein